MTATSISARRDWPASRFAFGARMSWARPLTNALPLTPTGPTTSSICLAGTTRSPRRALPAGYIDGIATPGTDGGQYSAVDRVFQGIGLGREDLSVNYNFGARPAPGSAETAGQAAAIGFWQNKKGQALIDSFGGGPSSTLLGDWLAATLPDIFGPNAGAGNDLAAMTNTYVAAVFQQRFALKGIKLDAQLMATALSVFATNASLGGAQASGYGFKVGVYGLGDSTFNVGNNGAAFGVANNTSMTVLDILSAADRQAVEGVLYNGNTALWKLANNVFDGINSFGSIS